VRCLRPHSDLKLANKSHNINLATTHTDDHWSLTVGFLVVQKIWLKCHGKRNLWTSVRYTITAVTTWNQLRSCSESRSKINRIRRVNRIPRDRSGGGAPNNQTASGHDNWVVSWDGILQWCIGVANYGWGAVAGALKMQDLTLTDLLLSRPALLARRRSDAQLCSIRS